MTQVQNQLTTRDLFSQKNIQERFEKLLGRKAPGFISSVLQVVNSTKLMAKADPGSVLNAAATAASLDLPINPSLGFAWIVPYKSGDTVMAQFQIGWKGFVQLALRSGQYRRINVTQVYANQFKAYNRLTEELNADFSIDGEGEVVGYAAYFNLLNGMEKLTYWTKEAVMKHASKYSQTYNKKSQYGLIKSPWNDPEQFDSMAMKTVLKNTISKWGIMSVEMQTAVMADQSVQEEEGQFKYLDNAPIDIEAQNQEEENKRIISFIEKAKNLEELSNIEETVEMTDEVRVVFDKRKEELK